LTGLPRRLVASAAWRWRRWRYRGTLNTPYLSGDFFRACCDIAFDLEPGTRPRFLAGLRTARSIFLKTDFLPEFFDRFAGQAEACRVLISGNSDIELHSVPEGLPPRLCVWFAQNATVGHPRLRPLPIGLENQALAHQGLRHNFRPCRPEELARKRLQVWVAFSDGGTAERAELRRRAATAPAMTVEPHRLRPAEFQQRVRQYRFVLAPRGNGIDTHRFWEALYADAIPVTRRTSWSESLKAEGIPLLDIEDWDEIFTWTAEHWARVSTALPDRPSSMAWLWAPFWRRRISSLAAGADTPPGES
jgi:hypothetical protein